MRCVKESAQAKGIEFKRVIPVGRKQSDPDDLCGFNKGGSRRRLPPPFAPTRTVSSIDCCPGLHFHIQQAGDHFSETVATIAHGKKFQMIEWPSLTPALSHEGRGGLGSERAFKLVGTD